jgi:hypothetical protein
MICFAKAGLTGILYSAKGRFLNNAICKHTYVLTKAKHIHKRQTNLSSKEYIRTTVARIQLQRKQKSLVVILKELGPKTA